MLFLDIHLGNSNGAIIMVEAGQLLHIFMLHFLGLLRLLSVRFPKPLQLLSLPHKVDALSDHWTLRSVQIKPNHMQTVCSESRSLFSFIKMFFVMCDSYGLFFLEQYVTIKLQLHFHKLLCTKVLLVNILVLSIISHDLLQMEIDSKLKNEL